MTIQSI
jgi:hypothetical protein